MPVSSQVLISALTVGLTGAVGVVLYFTGDGSWRMVTDFWFPTACTLAAGAAPLALIYARGEVDLSGFGIAAIGGYAFAEMSNLPTALTLTVVVGALIGATSGLLRWATLAPSALLTLGTGFVASYMAGQLTGERGVPVEVTIRGSAVPFGAAVVLVAGAVVWNLVDRPTPARAHEPTALLIGLYALSGGATAVYGGLGAGRIGFVTSAGPQSALLFLVAAVAVGGVVAGSPWFAPALGALGGFAVALVAFGATLQGWEVSTQLIVLAVSLLVSIMISHGLRRLLGPVRSDTWVSGYPDLRTDTMAIADPPPPPPPGGRGLGQLPPPPSY